MVRVTGSEPWAWSAVEMASAVRSGDVSSAELVTACLRRIEVVNPAINAVVRLADGSLDLARQADADLRRGIVHGPLHGIPCTIKDSLDTAGVITTAGTVGWAERVPERDATVVARLKAAGAILLGKTNTPEFTWANDADNLVYGRTSNPYDLDRSPGGSSGGSAAIVAAGGSPFDIGSDTGDSIRQPAHVCGVAGLKPTSGRVPRTGHHPSYRGILESLTQLGPIARRVDDLALVLPIIAGPDGEDPHVAPVPLRDLADMAITGLRVAWFADNGVQPPTPETMTTIRAAADALRDAGARVDERVPPDQARAVDLWERLVDADGHAWLRRLMAHAGTEGIGSYAGRADRMFASAPLPGDELTALVEAVDDVRASMLGWMRDVDLIVSPVLPRPALPHGDGHTSAFADTYSEVHNLTGWPAAVVRGGTSPEGLPIGVQLIGQPWREDVVLAGARVVEDALGGWQPPPELPWP
jgi:amidase